MTKLTRYTSFKKLKLRRNSISRAGSDHPIELSEFEEFITALRKASLEKSKATKTRSLSGQKPD